MLSTIHANGAVEVVQRLLGLGVEKYLIASCLRFSAAQRIARKLCGHCSLEAEPSAIPSREDSEGTLHFRTVGNGCEHCNKGYTGLLPIFEYMGPSEINTFASDGFSGLASPKVSLKQAYYAAARQGLVDITEVNDFA